MLFRVPNKLSCPRPKLFLSGEECWLLLQERPPSARLKPWGILAFLAFGKRTEALLGPGLVLSPNDLQGERAVSMFPQRVFMTLENIWGDNF